MRNLEINYLVHSHLKYFYRESLQFCFLSLGEKTAFTFLKENQIAFMKRLSSAYTSLTTSNEVVISIADYICIVYPLRAKNDINKGQYELFKKGLKLINENQDALKKYIVGYGPSQFVTNNTRIAATN